MYNENNYLKALGQINNLNLIKSEWLLENFILYNQSLNWPNDLPPIKRTCKINSTIVEKFNLIYESILSEFDYRFDNESKTLTLK
jgi:hypothetical protein